VFSKIFEQIFDSSIAEDYQVRFVFEDFLTLADIDGVVDKTPEAISRRTNVPIEIINRAIKVLEAPDATSRRSNDDGRRIVRLDEHREWGWFIVNYEHYRQLASEEQRRAKTRDRVRKHREKHQCNAPVTLANDSPSPSIVTSSCPSSKNKGKRFKPPTPEEVEAYGKSIDFGINGKLFIAHYAAAGWKRGKAQTPITNWKLCVHTWKERDKPQKTAKEKREYDEPGNTARIFKV